jgi:hypothetical protein
MKRYLLLLAVAATLAASALLVPSRAEAMGVGAAAAMDFAANETSLLEEAAYVCRHRWRTSRRDGSAPLLSAVPLLPSPVSLLPALVATKGAP